MELPSIEELYPFAGDMKDKGDKTGTGLKAVKWLESQGLFVEQDFILQLNFSDEFVTLRFKKKKHYSLFKDNKKAIRAYE